MKDRLRLLAWCIVIGLGLSPFVNGAEGLRGAAAILEEAQERAGGQEKKVEAGPAVELRKALDDFKKSSKQMGAEEAATGWLGLVDKYFALENEGSGRSRAMMMAMRGGEAELPLTFQEIFKVIPGPASWEALEKLVQKRPAPEEKSAVTHHALRLLVATLNGKVEEQKAALKDFEAAARKNPMFRQMLAYNLGQLRAALLEFSDNALDRKQMIYDQLAYYETSSENDAWMLPDVVLALGAEEAEKILRRALVLPKVDLTFVQGEQTRKLARKVALEVMEKIVNPPWSLVDSPEGVELYEALAKKFPELDEETAAKLEASGLLNAGRHDYERKQATANYAVGLILKNRFEEAEKVFQGAKEDPEMMIYGMGLGYDRKFSRNELTQIAKFLKGYLEIHPEAPLWQMYAAAAMASGQSEMFLGSVETVLKGTDVEEDVKARVRSYHYGALLAADKVEEGINAIRSVLAQKDDDEQREPGYEGPGQAIATLAKLGEVLKQPALIEEAVKAYEERAANKKSDPYGADVEVGQLVEVLVRAGQLEKAESILAKELKASEGGRGQGSYGRNEGKPQVLTLLAQVYSAAGRPKDVIALLENAPWWGSKDLAELQREVVFDYFHQKNTGPDIQHLAAKALAAEGRNDEALKITQAVLNRKPGYDPAYQLLIELQGNEALGFLEKLYEQDRFEERPLIWKGVILNQQKKFEEAEKVLREAISIDPSDGEQGSPNRMRVYGVLAQARAGRGDAKEAEFFQNVTKAIRLAEEADKVHGAGLITRALKMYEESLTHFADAYCIQSRLALRYSELGLDEAAEEHYQRAYELMPDSFGRVESHCFGCEGVFNDTKAQGIAERVFTKLVASQPEKPQVHYLLGYLRTDQQRHEEALEWLGKAVKLDPDYLNAWVKMQSLEEQVLLPMVKRNEIALNILRLDPLQRHGRASLEGVSDLAGLWKAAERAVALRPAKPEKLFELSASKARMEEAAEALKKAGGPGLHMNYARSVTGMERDGSPAEYLLRQKVVGQAVQMLQGT